MKFLIKSLAILACVSLIASCASTGGGCRDKVDPTIEARPSVNYLLGVDDELRVIVFGEEDLSGEYVVGGQGSVALPLIGDVPASGTTLQEFEDAVEAALREGYLNDPKVSVQVLNYRPYYILGEVNNPGQYPYSEGLSVPNAVAIAGGFTYRANRCRAFIRRGGEPGETPYDLTADTPVQPGDTIRIPERFL